ncbi:MAG: Omp28-related outer membrane protein [Candidatus Coatesbacteria bacterium]|nr:Omp28-related outer membrane protein [Candidatus Coatesbacteria bacterium]
MDMRKTFAAVFTLLLICFSCEKLPNPYDNNDDDASNRLVLLELFTTTTDMENCDRANRAADLLKSEEAYKVTVIQWHSSSGDTFGNDTTQARFNYYNVTSMPLAIFDGLEKVYYSSNMYNEYYDAMIVRQEMQTPINLRLSGSVRAGSSIKATIIVNSPPGNGDFYLRMVLLEDGIIYTDKGTSRQYTLNCVARDTFGYYLGDEVRFGAGDSISVSHLFTIDRKWNKERMYVVAFIQNDRQKEILQSAYTNN